MLLKKENCSSVSTPSASVLMPRCLHMSTMLRMMTGVRSFCRRRNIMSSFARSNLKFCSVLSEEYPLPKSSSQTSKPSIWNLSMCSLTAPSLLEMADSVISMRSISCGTPWLPRISLMRAWRSSWSRSFLEKLTETGLGRIPAASFSAMARAASSMTKRSSLQSIFAFSRTGMN